jgi:ribosomal-protein-alanine N-acetyltransferase
VYSIGAVTAAGRAVVPDASSVPAAAAHGEADPLVVEGPSLSLRYAVAADAERLLELGSDPAVTRFFSWGPYTDLAQPRAYIAELPGRRARGEQLDFLVVHRDDGPIGVTGLSELSLRDRRATASTRNGRSQIALERLGFRREGVLAAWHRHGGVPHDVVVFGLLRAAWEQSRMQAVPVEFRGTPPAAFVAG